jgi:hypothetical protein
MVELVSMVGDGIFAAQGPTPLGVSCSIEFASIFASVEQCPNDQFMRLI